MIGALRFVALTGEAGMSASASVSRFLRTFHRFAALTAQTFARSWLVVKNPDLTVAQMFTLGIESLPLVAVIAIFLGSETVIQAVYQMAGIVPMRYLGVLVCKSLSTELGPVIISMVVAGRVATGIAAEIGAMKATEQLDAMKVLRLDPIRYLIAPRTVACIIMLPVLVIGGEFLAFLGSIVMVALSVDITMTNYLSGLRLFFDAGDLYMGVFKTIVFGADHRADRGALRLRGQGRRRRHRHATTRAVITAAVLILVFDFVIAVLVL